MPTITKTIGTDGREYATIAAWEADLDDDIPYDAGDIADGRMYNDTNFNEAGGLTLNGGNTLGLAFVHLSPAAGEEHTGIAGTGVRHVSGADTNFVHVNTQALHRISHIEWNANGFGGSTATQIFQTLGFNARHIVRRCILHNAAGSHTMLGLACQERVRFTNNIVYNLLTTNGGIRICVGIFENGGISDPEEIWNNTCHNLTNTAGSGACYGMQGDDRAEVEWKNNICIECNKGTTTGTKQDFETGLSNPDKDYNCASDSSAEGSNSINTQTALNLFVSTTGGSENYHLKSGANAIDDGVDKGTTDEANFDIDNVARTGTWDMGADQFVAAGGPFPHFIRRSNVLSGGLGVGSLIAILIGLVCL